MVGLPSAPGARFRASARIRSRSSVVKGTCNSCWQSQGNESFTWSGSSYRGSLIVGPSESSRVGLDSSIAPTTVRLFTETPEKSRNKTRDNAGTHTNTESQRQTHRQLTTQCWGFRPPEFSWAPVLLSILPLCPGNVLLPRSRDPRQAPKCCAQCLNPRARREKASKTMQLAKRGSLLLTRATALCCIRCSGAGQRAPSPSCYTNL